VRAEIIRLHADRNDSGNARRTRSPRVTPGNNPRSAIHLRIADITVRIAVHDADLSVRVDDATERFLVPPCHADATLTARWGDAGGAASGDLLFDSGSVWKLYRDGEHFRFLFASPALGPLPYKEARFEPDFTSGAVTLRRACFRSAQGVWPLEYPLDELLVQGLLARGRGAEIHACGVADATGRGLLFVGQSGAGKTTMARLWEGVRGTKVLSDDRIILRHLDDGFTLYGTPWHGEAALAEAASAPLAGVFFLEHGEANALVPLTGATAATRLLACGFPPFYDRGGLDFTLAFFAEIAATVPCHELRFAPDGRVVEFVETLASRP
jgi:hypothetical protein